VDLVEFELFFDGRGDRRGDRSALRDRDAVVDLDAIVAPSNEVERRRDRDADLVSDEDDCDSLDFDGGFFADAEMTVVGDVAADSDVKEVSIEADDCLRPSPTSRDDEGFDLVSVMDLELPRLVEDFGRDLPLVPSFLFLLFALDVDDDDDALPDLGDFLRFGRLATDDDTVDADTDIPSRLCVDLVRPRGCFLLPLAFFLPAEDPVVCKSSSTRDFDLAFGVDPAPVFRGLRPLLTGGCKPSSWSLLG